MKVLRRIQPGKAGTKKYLEEYGEKLVCVRYIYDEEEQTKTKTIELVVEKRPWHKTSGKISESEIMHVRVNYRETELRKQIKSAGGKWNREEKVWELSYRDVKDLELTDRIIE